MKKLLFTAAILFGLQLGFSDAPKAAPENTTPGIGNSNPCFEVCVTLVICNNTCVVCGCTFAQMEIQRHDWEEIYCH